MNRRSFLSRLIALPVVAKLMPAALVRPNPAQNHRPMRPAKVLSLFPAGEGIDAGQFVYLDANGRWQKGFHISAPMGVAMHVASCGQAVKIHFAPR